LGAHPSLPAQGAVAATARLEGAAMAKAAVALVEATEATASYKFASVNLAHGA